MSNILPPAAQIAQAAQKSLSGAGTQPFSDAAFQMLERRIEQYIDDLIVESVRVMNRHQADTVSPSYVEQASETLVAGRRRKVYTLIGTIGGILFGAAVSAALEMLRQQSVSSTQAVTAGLLGVVGSVLIALQFARE